MKKSHLSIPYLKHFFVFNLCFFILQFALVRSQSGSFTSLIELPWRVYIELLYTLFVHIGLYLVLSLLQTFLLIGIMRRKWHYFTDDQWVIIIWTLSVCALLCANAYYFPLSIYSKLLSPALPEFLIKMMFLISLSVLSFLLLNSLLHRTTLLIVTPIIALIVLMKSVDRQTASIENHASQPNIIILGIDSLSPESITKENMPFLFELLQTSTQFSNTISPLARTYPAWSSILTGLYAIHHHAEENLVAKNQVNTKASIAWQLAQNGYNTIYATDDRRFNSIGKEFGFKQVIGPKLGVNDVILGTYNDFPLGNLLINFPISSWLFPYNFDNRASFFSYYPQTFNKEVKKVLDHEKQKSPLFLAVHFTLPHWPYAWAESLPEQVNNEFSLEKRDLLYQSAIKKVDKQYKSLFLYLKKNHYLKNSLVILLSDHGEVLYYHNSRLTNYSNYQGALPSKLDEYLKNNTATVLDKSAGHGSDILSPNQYKSVLAFRMYRNDQLTTTATTITDRVALIDIAPTILNILHIPIKTSMDGISLLQNILHPNTPMVQRSFYIESGMFPNSNVSKEKAIEIGRAFYVVNSKNGELELKASGLQIIERQKIYGVIRGDWILALYPDDDSYIPVIQNLKNSHWSDDLNSSFAKTSPANELKQELQRFYGPRLHLPVP